MITSSEILKNHLQPIETWVVDRRIHSERERVEGFANKASLEALQMGACLYFCENSSIPLPGFTFETEDIKRWEATVPFIEDLFFFLTDRTISIELIKRKSPKQMRIIDPISDGRDVMLFSGGCDSFCGVHWAIKNKKSIALAHTMTSTSMLGKADQIHKNHFSVEDIPLYHISSMFSSGSLNRFYPQVRSTLFSFNAVPIMERFQSSTLWIPENGPLMINPPLSNFAISTRSTRPEALRLLSKILTAYLGRKIVVDSPFKNQTKAEIIANSTAGKTVLDTYSCFNYRWGRYEGMCGRCYGCNTTRFSMYALGIDDKRYHENYCPFDEATLPKKQDRKRAVFLFSDFIDTCNKLALGSSVRETTDYWMRKAQMEFADSVDVRELMQRFGLDMLTGIDSYFSKNRLDPLTTILGKRFHELMLPDIKEKMEARRDILSSPSEK